MRMADITDLQHDLVNRVPSFIIQKGSMFQRLHWPTSSTYGSICQLYRAYTCNHNQNALVVFERYENDEDKTIPGQP